MVTLSDPYCPSFFPISYLVANLSNTVYYSGIGLVPSFLKGSLVYLVSELLESAFVCVINVGRAGVLHFTVIVFTVLWFPCFL